MRIIAESEALLGPEITYKTLEKESILAYMVTQLWIICPGLAGVFSRVAEDGTIRASTVLICEIRRWALVRINIR